MSSCPHTPRPYSPAHPCPAAPPVPSSPHPHVPASPVSIPSPCPRVPTSPTPCSLSPCLLSWLPMPPCSCVPVPMSPYAPHPRIPPIPSSQSPSPDPPNHLSPCPHPRHCFPIPLSLAPHRPCPPSPAPRVPMSPAPSPVPTSGAQQVQPVLPEAAEGRDTGAGAHEDAGGVRGGRQPERGGPAAVGGHWGPLSCREMGRGGQAGGRLGGIGVGRGRVGEHLRRTERDGRRGTHAEDR